MPKQDRSEYFKQYREKNREKLNKRQREWARENPEKIALYRLRHWARKLEQLQESK
ncbi:MULTISPECIES: hypothetical protein [unclassified Priestia]|uniref:hypothetical protein n=1 Tax=unclassified Priestia TaxID=2800374 RepID=UPI00366B43AF